jgi:hypothetical protein
VAGVLSPVEQLRRAQKIAPLRLFVLLYGAQTFAREGGVEWRAGGIRQPFDRFRLGEMGERFVWAFRPRDPEIDPAADFVLASDESDIFQDLRDAYDGLAMLQQVGLVEIVPHLVEADHEDAEMIHPVPVETGDADERVLTDLALDLAVALIGPERIEQARGDGYTLFVPVLRHLSEVQVVGVARLKHRPQTKLTQAWLSHAKKIRSGYADAYASALGR